MVNYSSPQEYPILYHLGSVRFRGSCASGGSSGVRRGYVPVRIFDQLERPVNNGVRSAKLVGFSGFVCNILACTPRPRDG